MQYDYSKGGIDKVALENKAVSLAEYQASLLASVRRGGYVYKEAALSAPFDDAQYASSRDVVAALLPVRHVVLVGIGGSSRGLEALYHALREDETPVLHVLDELDSAAVRQTMQLLKGVPLVDIAIVVISKSGTTTETLANADVLLSELSHVFGESIYGRVICVGNAGTPLALFAEHKHIPYVAMPEPVGGRYSVFTAVGLVPMELLGFSTVDFLSGAKKAIERGLTEIKGSAVMSGTLLGFHCMSATKVYVLFSEDSRLDMLMNWYQQLIAESLGKRTNDDTSVGVVPLPMSPRDLHSTAQLYLSGFEGVFTGFFRSVLPQSQYTISDAGFGSLMKLNEPRTYDRLPKAIMGGVHRSYAAERLMHALHEIEGVTPAALGELMAEKMLEVIFAAHILKVNAFDQPHVELYKEETRRILAGEVE